MKVGDPIMRVFKYGDNWIGIVAWINKVDDVVMVRWSHNEGYDTHHISILTEIK
jgi:hypothetical protein